MKYNVIGALALLTLVTNAWGQTEPLPRERVVDLGNDVRLEMVLIPAGEFVMGDEGDKPAHTVQITRPFYLGKFEVTQEQWQAVQGNNPSQFLGARNPVDHVSWEECQTFLQKLNEKYRPAPGKFALPTEAQWEYACRAGTTTMYSFPSRTTFFFFDREPQLAEYAWYNGNAGRTTHPVGGKKANPFGLYDMHGNVWEWCADWYNGAYYTNSPAADPTGPATGTLRIMRGGGWEVYAESGYCRSALRNALLPQERSGCLGLRVCWDPTD